MLNIKGGDFYGLILAHCVPTQEHTSTMLSPVGKRIGRDFSPFLFIGELIVGSVAQIQLVILLALLAYCSLVGGHG